MKRLLFVAIIGLMTACHSPRYAANFQYYKTTVGYDDKASRGESVITPVEPEKLTASTASETVVAEEIPAISPEVRAQVRKAYFQMSKEERKSLRKSIKSALKNNSIHRSSRVNASPAPNRQWWQGWDQDLKLAAIFGAIGTVAIIIYVEPFLIIGAVALIIGLVFFIKWFARQ